MTPQAPIRYVREDGRLTTEGILLLQEQAQAIAALQAALEALTDRVTALETP